MEYRKKEPTIRAVQFTNEESANDITAICELFPSDCIAVNYNTPGKPYIKLPYDLVAQVSDYILMDSNGRYSVLPEKVFKGTYESATINGSTSDGYHTFDELYYHRMMLFAVICNKSKRIAWKSKLHADGTMYPNYFIVGVTTPEGDYSYHYHEDYWDMFQVITLTHAPEWDGHEPKDITRLLSIV